MRPFNLDEYLKNPERKVVTRDGRDVRIICTDFDNPNYPGICEIKGSKWPYSFATNGELIKGKKLSGDLFFATEKPKVEKFNPKTFQPFDKVLSKYYIDKEWVCGILSHPYCHNEFNGFIVNSNFVRYCIPYNEETKHLVGTLDDCPEYYKWWED